VHALASVQRLLRDGHAIGLVRRVRCWLLPSGRRRSENRLRGGRSERGARRDVKGACLRRRRPSSVGRSVHVCGCACSTGG